jgi:hypothetical protein
MDTRLKQALDLSNSLETLSNQRHQALSKYNQNLILFYNGGTFKVDYSLLSTIQTFSDVDDFVVVDSNNIPILINNREEFFFLVKSRIIEATRSYYQEYESLKKIRTPEGLLKK